MTSPLWTPDETTLQNAHLTRFQHAIERTYGVELKTYKDLHLWSVTHLGNFWEAVWDFCKVIGDKGPTSYTTATRMIDARFFTEGRLNYAENILKNRSDDTALIFWGEDQAKRSLTFKELYDHVSRMAQALHDMGIKTGDRVAGFVPNTPESIIAMLATATLGAIWSSCSPDFGVQGVLDRFGQIEPKVLFASDYYLYRGTPHESLTKLKAIAEALPTLERTILFSYQGLDKTPHSHTGIPNVTSWEEIVSPHSPTLITFERFPFNAPLFIMFSSGTTGVPKCIIHGAGGTLLQHLKEHQLHCDLKPLERLFYFTTCGWMMWNWQVSALASGVTLLLYDGSPFYPTPAILFDYADAEHMTIFGTAAKFIDALSKEGASPRKSHSLAHLRLLTSTGSPLTPEGFDYIYDHIKSDLAVASISGGTDIISCFVLGVPTLPVWRGEIQGKGLGMDVHVYSTDGIPIQNVKGELVCRSPFPSMPIGFWNDPDHKKYLKAYFQRFSNTWRHGDFAEITEHEGIIIYGRSDAVLNPGGVRIGTAEIYRQVERVDEVLESIAVGQSYKGDTRIILFIKLKEGVILDDALSSRIKKEIRTHTTPRHVPALILQVPDIPRTKNGKLVELAVRDVIENRPVLNREALANPEALDHFRNLDALKD